MLQKPRRCVNAEAPDGPHCGKRNCPRCIWREGNRIIKRTLTEWRLSYGRDNRAVLMTLTYRPDAGRNPEQAMEFHRRCRDRLRQRWNRSEWAGWEYVWGLQWTALGTPHLHMCGPLAGPLQRGEDIGRFTAWLTNAWREIVDDPDNNPDVRVLGSYKDAVRYTLREIVRPARETRPPGLKRKRGIHRHGKSSGWEAVIIKRDCQFLDGNGNAYDWWQDKRIRARLRYWRRRAARDWWDTRATEQLLWLARRVAALDAVRPPARASSGPWAAQYADGRIVGLGWQAMEETA